MSVIKNIKPHGNLFISILFGLMLVSFLLLTKPSDKNFSLSLIPLLLLWISSYFFVLSILGYVIKSLRRSARKILSVAVASTAVLAVMFSALGQLSMFDVVLLLFLMTLGAFYFSRTWPK